MTPQTNTQKFDRAAQQIAATSQTINYIAKNHFYDEAFRAELQLEAETILKVIKGLEA